MKTKLMIFSLIVISFGFSRARDMNTEYGIYQSGEMLKYKVKWSFIRLGTITIQTTLDSSYTELNHFLVKMTVQSSPFAPFIDIDEINETLINSASGMSKSFYAKHKEGSDYVEINCNYDGVLKQAFFSEKDLKQNNYNKLELLRNVPPYVDGPSLFFYSRRIIHSNKLVSLPTMINGVIEQTDIDCTGPIEFIEVEAIPGLVRTKCYKGFANWEGGTSAGMSGEFAGWISDDEAAVILRAELNVLVGSLVIELEEYKREGWIPPRKAKAYNLTQNAH